MARRLVAALIAVACAHAAVPPLGEDARKESAKLILTGTIVSSTTEDVSRGTNAGHVDSVSIGQFTVSSVVKGSAEDAQTVYWWSPKERPAGWTGHQGQSPPPPPNTPITIYADEHGELLVPNGWAPAPAAAAPAETEKAPAAAEKTAPAKKAAASEKKKATPAPEKKKATPKAAKADAPVTEKKDGPLSAFVRALAKVLSMPLTLLKKLFKKKQ